MTHDSANRTGNARARPGRIRRSRAAGRAADYERRPGQAEGPYVPNDPLGVDRLIESHQRAGFRPNEGNLYAELGSTWRYFMTRPDEAAHVLGKLLKYFGDERIMWGTDSIWYGSPQD
jgi:uncharacterized protein